jgi:hypothetical protein
MKKIVRLTESDLNKIVRRVLNEEQSRSVQPFRQEIVKGIVEKLNDIFSSAFIRFNEEDDYGLEPGKFKWFKRRLEVFNTILADNIYTVQIGEYEWLMEEHKEQFIKSILIDTLLSFFSNVDGEDYDGEDFQRDGRQEGWLYFTKDIYEDELGKIYNELKNK